MLMRLIVVLLASNNNNPDNKDNTKKKCEAWMRDNMENLIALRSKRGVSILHAAIDAYVFGYPRLPIVRLLVEVGKMDVNVRDISDQTPLHLLSDKVLHRRKSQPTEEETSMAEILINHGAHMDSKDVHGREASNVFSQKFPQWSFNFSLKCLAARAMVKYGVKYEKLPGQLTAFIEEHKARLKQCKTQSK